MRAQQAAPWLGLPPAFRARFSRATPDSFAGLVAWGEGSDLGADGTAISSWLNKTGSGLNPAQSTAGNKPTVKASAINGQPAALFTAASNQFLTFPAGSLGWFQNVPGVTLIAVVQPVSLLTSRIINAGVNASVAVRASLQGVGTAYRYAGRALDADTPAVLDSAAGTQATGVPAIVLSVMACTTAQAQLYFNGALAASVSGTITAGNTQNSPSFSISLGATSTPSNPFDGYIAAYAMYNVAYSRLQLAGVLNRWSALYGIPITG